MSSNEKKIGERFKDGDMELEVVEAVEALSCEGCAYQDLPAFEQDGDSVVCFRGGALAVHGNCLKDGRSDRRSVIFRKV